MQDAAPTEPFLWPGGRLGCLLVHGLTSTPYEMRYLGERLRSAGYGVCGVQLAGHATGAADLEPYRWRDWYASVEDGLDRLCASSAQVVAVGLSLGALLVLRLAHEHAARVAGVVVLSTVLELSSRWPARLAKIISGILPMLPERLRFASKAGSDIADPDARRVHPSYRRIPLRSVVELIALQREVQAILPAVRQPVLAIHSEHDHTAPLANLDVLRRTLPNLRRSVVLAASYHVVSVDVERERVVAEIERFLAELTNAATSASRA